MEIVSCEIRLYPKAAQAEQIEKTFACCGDLWNRMIADEAKLQAEMGRHFIPTPAKYKREWTQLKEVDSLALATVHQKLEKAFQEHSFNPHDHPKPERLECVSSYTTYCQQTKYGPTVRFEGAGLRLPKIGLVKTAAHRELPEEAVIKSVCVAKDENGYSCTLVYTASAALEKQPA